MENTIHLFMLIETVRCRLGGQVATIAEQTCHAAWEAKCMCNIATRKMFPAKTVHHHRWNTEPQAD